ncbi:MAG: hypothetical protein U0174_08205 [Polyangiaceae bacterium]
MNKPKLPLPSLPSEVRRPRSLRNLVLLGSVGSALVVACSSGDGAGGGDGGTVNNGDGGTVTVVGPDGGTQQLPASATNKIKDGDETDVDCGGAVALRCADGKNCIKGSDCASQSCVSGVCVAPSATDGIKNGSESDVDCGGSSAPACADGKRCKAATDCDSKVCVGSICQAPSSSDGVKNGTETGTDCGGADTKIARCPVGQGCAQGPDCTSLVCTGNACVAPTNTDGVKNGTETGIDCGGPDAGTARCPVGQGCTADADCGAKNCDTAATKLCAPQSPTNGKKDGDESDVDCGGTNAPKCAANKLCTKGDDCASGGCGYKGRCVTARSCTGHFGGDTCGLGETGTAGAENDDCCKTAPVTVGGNTVQLDVYKVTAGRMRTFLNAVNGNVRKFIQDTRAANKIPAGVNMRATWDLYLPVSFDGNTDPGELSHPGYPANGNIPGVYTSANRQLSGFMYQGQNLGQQGCRIDAPGTHTYWLNQAQQAATSGDMPFAYNSSDLYDTKALNCVNYLMAQAFCIWDGGRLETFDEWLAAWGPAGFPWGGTPAPKGQTNATYAAYRFPTATDASLRNNPNATPSLVPPAGYSIEYATFIYSYEYPDLRDVVFNGVTSQDYMSFINAPGRLRGRGPAGHADIVGTMMETTSENLSLSDNPASASATWTSNGSFEGHGWSKGRIWSGFSLMNKYGKQGLRCTKL